LKSITGAYLAAGSGNKQDLWATGLRSRVDPC
jgi:hypothetical protein